MNQTLSNNILKELQFPEFHLVLGGLSGQSDPGSFNSTADALIARRIKDTETSLVADNNEWQYGKIYNSWSPGTTTNYYVYNPNNRIVYICTDNTPNGRIDEEPAISTVIPSHTLPEIQAYNDGYSWIPYYKVDITQLEFLSQTDLPIPNLGKSQSYTTFADQYNSLCGSGITTYGCCCLYFKESSVDEVTGEIYNAGDVTNEVVFSDCFECQKLADALDKDVLFLSGVTSGGITSSHPTENPLCPATKTIYSLQQELLNEQYTLIPGSSREYALYLLNNFTNGEGILAARIDLSGLTDAQKTITTENPEITIKDKTGTGARVRLLTVPVGYNQYMVTGAELLASGSNYSQVTDWSLNGTIVDNYIQLIHFPPNFYNDPTILTPGKRYRLKLQVTSDDLQNNISVQQITKFAVLTNPKVYGTDATVKYPSGDSAFRPLQTNAFAITGPYTEIGE
jgi:hypothetical protein